MNEASHQVQEAETLLDTDSGKVEELKPFHAVLLIVTLLHAIGISLWVLVFLTSSKRTLRVYNIIFFPTFQTCCIFCIDTDDSPYYPSSPTTLPHAGNRASASRRLKPMGPAADPRRESPAPEEDKKDK